MILDAAYTSEPLLPCPPENIPKEENHLSHDNPCFQSNIAMTNF